MKNSSIVIVGGGFCGFMTAYHLLKNTVTPLNITLINSGYGVAKGIAYGTGSEKFLLNVPAAKMSAIPSQPDQFVNWLHQKHPFNLVDKVILGKMFVPRREYGNYLQSLCDEINQDSSHHTFTIIDDFADDLITDSINTVVCKSGKKIQADIVVLATGNETPGNPPIEDESFYNSPSYFNNPWNEDSFRTIDPAKNVLIVGNGLTMVDTVLGLHEQRCTGTIYSLSPHGFNILPHRHAGLVYTKLLEEIEEPLTLNSLFTLFNKHVRILRHFGLSAEPIVDSVRPLVQEIWKKMKIEERRRFLTHIRHLWGVARHRLPLHIYDFMQNLRLQNKLIVQKGKLLSIKESSDGIMITYLDVKTQSKNNITVGRVINCTGPSLDISKSRNPFIKNLVEKGILCPDDLHLGINTDLNGNIIQRNGTVNRSLYTLGGNLRGLLWESTAVPELRVQAVNLAGLIVQQLQSTLAIS
ncbi:MAG: FAD/NAD(P)-binding protein [Bacteroidota bacterium]